MVLPIAKRIGVGAGGGKQRQSGGRSAHGQVRSGKRQNFGSCPACSVGTRRRRLSVREAAEQRNSAGAPAYAIGKKRKCINKNKAVHSLVFYLAFYESQSFEYP